MALVEVPRLSPCKRRLRSCQESAFPGHVWKPRKKAGGASSTSTEEQRQTPVMSTPQKPEDCSSWSVGQGLVGLGSVGS